MAKPKAVMRHYTRELIDVMEKIKHRQTPKEMMGEIEAFEKYIIRILKEIKNRQPSTLEIDVV